MIQRVSFALVSLTAALLAARAASAGEVCIPPQVNASLSACGGLHLDAPAAKRGPPVVAPPAPPSKGATRTPAPPDPHLSATDLRRGLASVRGMQLLVAEVQGLETLLASTAAGSPDRPGLVRRLADDYVELEASSFRKKVEQRAAADEARRKEPGKVAGMLAEATRAEKVEKAARGAAIKLYREVQARYPRWCQNSAGKPPAGCIDETLYDLAYEHEQAGDLGEARKVYLDLIQSAPSSKYVPAAYLAFGELFFQEAQGDPSKWALAEQSYQEVTRYPAPENKVLGYAHYKLAYVYWNKGDLAQAMSELKKTVDFGTQFSALPNAAQIASSARHDLVPLYALAGDPKRAYDFFHPLSGDASGSQDQTFRMMGELGQGYLDVGHYREGIDLYQDLLRRDRGDRSCAYQGHVTEATLALKTGDKAAAKAELDRQLQIEQRFRAEAHPDEAKRVCANVTAQLAVETAMIWHLEAVGSGNVRGTMAPETLSAAADLYDRVIKQFTAADFARFEFPRLVKEDWPTLLKVKSDRAELLYATKDWARAGAAFDAVVEEDPRGPLAAESAYASALAYQQAYLATHRGHSDRAGLGSAAGTLTARELSAGEKAMLASFDRFLCVAKPNPADRAAYDSYVEVEFARARTLFDAHRWPEAAAALRPVALTRADHELGVVAAQLYLETLNVMGSHGTPACIDEMARDVPTLVEKHCAGERGKTNADQCGILARVQRDMGWRVVEKEAQQIGEGTGPEHAKAWEHVANGYLGLWTSYGKEACEAKQPACERMDAVLSNAARAFQAARLLAKAIAVRKIILDPRYGLDHTAQARESVRELGKNYQAIAVYDESAGWYERFAQDSPKVDKAADALEDAIVLRLGLGQEEQALRDAELFQRTYRAQHPALAAQVAFAIGAHDMEREDFVQAKRRLSAAMAEIDRSGTVDVQIQAHALLGRALWRTGGDTGAAAEYAKVRALYRDPAAVQAKLKGGDDEGQQQRRLGKVVTAVGEALFFAAAQKQKVVDALRYPEYKGSGRRADVEAHINGKVAEWIKKKGPAIEEAEKEYRQILDLTPQPPPRWVIAAGARVGQMWGKFVAEFRAAPIPKEWKQNGPSPFGDLTWEEIRGAYYGAIDLKSEPYRLRAKTAYQGCLQVSARFQFFDEHSRACETWLAKNYGAEFHVLDELRGAPSRVGVRLEGFPVSVDAKADAKAGPEKPQP